MTVRIRLRPRLVNRRDQDPGLFLELEGARDAFLIDCGSLDAIPKVDLLRLSHIFVTHTHIDHFCGFDRVLRHVLASENVIHVFGPTGITANVQGKLDGYTWNLIEEGGPAFVVHELENDRMLSTEFRCLRGFKPTGPGQESRIEKGLIVDDGRVRVHFGTLEHRIPCLAYSVEEVDFPSIRADRIETMGIRGGPWIAKLQERVFTEIPEGETIEIEGTQFSLRTIVDDLVEIKRGRKVCYVTDTIFNERTLVTVGDLVKDADEFFCESNYQDVDEAKAAAYFHLTARQAARFAKQGSVKKLILFHISRKYQGDFRASFREAREEFPRVD